MSVSFPDGDDSEAMRNKKDLLNFCMEKTNIFSDQVGFAQHESALATLKDRLLRRIKTKETNLVPGINHIDYSFSIYHRYQIDKQNVSKSCGALTF